MSDTVTITQDDRERLREIGRLVEVDSIRDDAQRDARFLHRFAERPALEAAPEHSHVPSVLGDEDRERLRTVAADLDERASIARYQSEASAFRVKAEFLRKLAEHPSSCETGLREHLNATFNRWANQKYANSVDLNGYDKAKERATAAAFRNAADYVLDADPVPSGDQEGDGQ
jgi:hypothetical protein